MKQLTIPFRRKRQSKTNYKKRLNLLKSNKTRLVVRKSNKHMLVQLIEYSDKGDKVVLSAHSKELKKFGWSFNCGNIPAAYLIGLLIGKKAKGKEVILDIGLQTPISESKIFAVLKGAIDSGIKVKFSEKVLPDEKRISGNHISEYATHLKKDKTKFEKVYSAYIKNKLDPGKIQDNFQKTKSNIIGEKNGKTR